MQASTNGVFVNDVKIMEQPLEHGDVVQFGGAADIAVGTRFGGNAAHIRCTLCSTPVALTTHNPVNCSLPCASRFDGLAIT